MTARAEIDPELDYAEIVTNSAGIGQPVGSEAAVPGLAIDVPEVVVPVYLHAHLEAVLAGNGAINVFAYITDDAGVKKGGAAITLGANAFAPMELWARLPAGTDADTYQVRVSRQGSVNVTIGAAATAPSFLRAHKA
jgi:hypothetical protein